MDKLRVGIFGSKFAVTLHNECYHCTNKVVIVAVAALDDLNRFYRSATEGRKIKVRW
jgi:hypothetical protein